MHTLRSSNLPFYSAVWEAAKASTGLVTFHKRFHWAAPTRTSKRTARPRKQCALVDIVAQGGLEWVKVSTVTETRLLFEQAKAGWENADSSSDDQDSTDGDKEDGVTFGSPNIGPSPASSSSPSTPSRPLGSTLVSSPSPSTHPIELLRLAIDLQTASQATQIHYKHPSVRIVLPKIPTNPSPPTLIILHQLLSTGSALQLGPSFTPFPLTASPFPSPSHPPSPPPRTPPSSLLEIFPLLLPNPYASLTPTLNVDCTILLALISDLSHSPQTPHSPSHHRAITCQIELEARDHLLPDCLYPALKGRDLVCTLEAAKRMQEIVALIGTPSERARADLLFDNDKSDPSATAPLPPLIARLASLSEYPVPPTLRLPITIAPVPTSILESLPPVAKDVAKHLSPINRSVFLFGWASGFTTVSSNRAVAKVVEGIVGGFDGEVVEGTEGAGQEREGVGAGPEIWLCGTARSLVGKERGRG